MVHTRMRTHADVHVHDDCATSQNNRFIAGILWSSSSIPFHLFIGAESCSILYVNLTAYLLTKCIFH